MKLKKNQTIELDIIDITNLGFGVGKHEGEVVFVSGAVTGERILAKIIKVKKVFFIINSLDLVMFFPMQR